MTVATIYTIGSIVRYSSGITALMKVESVNLSSDGNHCYYGTQFYGGSVGARHNGMRDATYAELTLWEEHHKRERLLSAARTAIRAIDEAMKNRPAKGDCANYLTMARSKIQCAIDEAVS